MFEPKVYKKNGLEAFRLVGSDGSEFFYEGVIDCNEKEIYRDEHGRLYFPVLTEIGGATRYFVELDLDFPLIPGDAAGDREKEIARLINASPRVGPQLPEDIFIPQAEEVPAIADPVPEEAIAPAPLEPADPKEQAPPETVIKPTETLGEREPARDAETPASKPKKARSMAVPIAIGVVVLVLIVAVTGVYVLKPGVFQGLTSIYGHQAPTPTLAPTPFPTEVPTVTATPEPTPAPASEHEVISTETMLQVQPLIDSGNETVTSFVTGHVAANSAGNPIRQCYDLYTFVNNRWNETSGETSQDLPASALTMTLSGDSKDYSVLMCALTASLGQESRVIACYKNDKPYYYPEILVADSSESYASAKADLLNWFGVTQPFGHQDDKGYWISLSIGTAPGTRVEASEEYAVYRSGPPVKIK